MTTTPTLVTAEAPRPRVDVAYLRATLEALLEIPSPTGYTDRIVHWTGDELTRLGIAFECTRRGAIRADLPGKRSSPDRAVVAHLDTLGGMVTALKPNGRLALAPIGMWSSRFAEGARVTIFTDGGSLRGTVLPLKASGHAFDREVDTQPVAWEQLEIRVDEVARSESELHALGIHVGDHVAFDASPSFSESGYINARHLDDKAGVAVVLTAARAVRELARPLPVDCHLIFTISEEVGSGSSHTLHGDVAEMVTVDNGAQAPGHATSEHAVTIAMMDSTGPFDYHLTHKLLALCAEYGIPHVRDVFKHYRSDSASAVEAGNDLRTALVCFGVDASHGHERTHVDSLRALSELTALYMLSEPTAIRDKEELAPLEGLPVQPT